MLNKSIPDPTPNPDKPLYIDIGDDSYMRMPIKTHVITGKDNLSSIFTEYIKPVVQKDDVIVVSEKAVACTQYRAIPLSEIKPGFFAKTLCKFVYKSPYGIGLSIPETMEMAIGECGITRILIASMLSAIGKLFGIRGWFYKIAGPKAQVIDGPCDCTIPPYNRCVVLGPSAPDYEAQKVSELIGCPVAIVDINDISGNILGVSGGGMDKTLLLEILRDNPLGQSGEQTPIGIIRKKKLFFNID